MPCEEDGPDLESLARTMDAPGSGVVARADPRLCTTERDAALAELVEEAGADALVVGGPSPRRHLQVWRRAASAAGVPADRLELVPLWEQCAGPEDGEGTLARRAAIMLEAALARVDLGSDRGPLTLDATDSALVVGGGVAGMQAAQDLGDLGHQVFLVERADRLGGRAHRLSRTYPTQECKPDGCCPHSCRDCMLTPDPRMVLSHPSVQVLLGSKVASVTGGYGGYHVTLDTPEGRTEVDVGAVVVATGTAEFDPAEMTHLSPGHPDVVTSLELEEMLDRQRQGTGPAPLRRPSDGQVPSSVHFIQCVGSRDEHHGTRDCSIVCCTYGLGQALELKRTLPPGTEVAMHYMDLRGPYRGFEDLQREAQEEGVLLLRGRPAMVEVAVDRLVISGEDVDLGEPVDWPADLVVLSVGQLPPEGTSELAGMLGAAVDTDGYLLEPSPAWGLWERRGVYVVGCAAGPRGIRYSVRDAREAALSIHVALRRAAVELVELVAEVDEDRCTGCGQCVEACSYDAVALEERTDDATGARREVAVVDPRKCQACGNCQMACPSAAVRLPGFTDGQLVAEVERASGGGRGRRR